MTEDEQRLNDENIRLRCQRDEWQWKAKYFEAEYDQLFSAINDSDPDWLSQYLLSTAEQPVTTG